MFRTGVVISTTAFLLYFFEHQLLGFTFSDEMWDALGWSGYGAILLFPPAFWWLWMLIWVAVSIGVYSFASSARSIYLLFAIFGLFLSLVGGFNAQSAWAGFLSGVSCILDGAVIVLAYLSPLRDKFR